jgi:hypothetical protein
MGEERKGKQGRMALDGRDVLKRNHGSGYREDKVKRGNRVIPPGKNPSDVEPNTRIRHPFCHSNVV